MKENSISTQLMQEHNKIAQMANRIEMRFDKKIVHHDIVRVWQTIAPSVDSIECALNGDDCTVLNVKFEEGGKIGKHSHSNEEIIFVAKGQIHDNCTGITTNENQTYVIPPNRPHEIVSDYAKCTVVFKPPFPRVEIINHAESS